MARLCITLAVVALAAATSAQNMNGVYEIGNPSGQGTYSTVYTDEYVEVLSPPLKTQYSEVYWTMMDAVPLPPDLVKRFANKTMAITGYEADQVWASSGESVPIYYSYNHHFEAYVNGAFSSLEEHDDVSDAASAYGGRGSHGSKYRHAAIASDPRPNSSIPVGQWFSEGNGGEYRMSYHGYPRGYAQLIDSPTAFQIQPMQIDTHNRDYNGTGFRAGPLPRASAAPENAPYSGLLECPCTTRINKVIEITYGSQTSGECSEPVRNATECYAAARTVGVPPAAITKNTTAADAAQPAGCSLVPDGKGAYTALFNTPSGGQGAPCSGAAEHVSGIASAVGGLVSIKLDLDAKAAPGGVATITLAGPAGVWFGVGFNASGMGDEPYTIIVNGTGGVQERKLADQAPGNAIATSVEIVSDTVSGKQRTVVLTRPFKGATPDHYTFDPALSTNIPLIMAAGNTPALAYHGKTKGTAQLTLTGVDAPTCICVAGMSGTINGLKFHKNCLPEPYGDLLRDHNPTCNVRDYEGGLSCCHHGWFLLDADQEIPAPVDEIQLKFRFYFQEYNASYHKNLVRLYYQTEAWSTEYDVLKAPAGTPPENTIDEISAHFKVSDMIKPCPTRQGGGCTGPAEKGIELVYAGAHCHAPSCLSLELYNADTGDLICRQVPGYGTDDKIFNEEGYLWIPPCVWGHEPGVLPPPFLSLDTNLMSIKRNNNTYTHYGEMASWQMRGLAI